MATQMINLNEATKEELDQIPQLGGQRAESIIHYRNEHGEFKEVNELRHVPGIGEQMATQVAEYFTIGG